MRTGKVSETVLKRSILKNIKYKSRELVQGPAAGESCGRLAAEKNGHLVFASVSVHGDIDDMAEKAFFRMANDICAVGGRLFGMSVTLFFSAQEEEHALKFVMGRLAELADTYKVDFLGGHTEVLETLSEPILSLNGTGFADAGVKVGSRYLEPGFDIVMTKWAGASGVAGMVKRERERGGFGSRFSDDFLDGAQKYHQMASCMKDVEIALQSEAAALYSVGAEGIFGALWNMGEASGNGITAELKKIPIRQETVEVCEFFDVNPYLAESDGVLLAGTPDGAHLVQKFERAGIPAAVIGEVTAGRDRVIVNGDEKRFLVPPGSGANIQ